MGLIYSGVKLWHHQAAKSLESKFQPYFLKIDKRLDSQDEVLEHVEHEVTINSGESLKDGVKDLKVQVQEVIDVLTTKPATALIPYPPLGLVDTLRVHGQTIDQIGKVVQLLADDIKPDHGSTGRDILNQIDGEQRRVAAEKARKEAANPTT